MEGANTDAQAVVELAKAVSGSGSIWITALFLIGAGVIAAQRFGLFSWLSNRTAVQSETFQDKLMAALNASHAREDQLLAKLDQVTARSDELREEVQKERFETRMFREQLRTLLRFLQQVRAGTLPIEAVPLPEIPGEPQ